MDKTPLRELVESLVKIVATIGLILLFVLVVVMAISYSKERYQRKYPGTTTMDWLLDSHG